MDNLQALINATPEGETLTLPPGEYEGPVVLPHGITIEGEKSTVWSMQGPVLRIQRGDVRLCGLRIEVTRFDAGMAEKPEHTALLVDPGVQVTLEDVVIRGYVEGIDGESGAWLLPPSVDLGILAPRGRNTFVLRVFVPVVCQMTSDITGLTVAPTSLKPGLNELEITAKDLYQDTLLLGRCYLRSAHVKRPINFTGRAASDGKVAPAEHRLLWEPSHLPACPPSVPQHERPAAPPSPLPPPPPVDRNGFQMTEQWLAADITRRILAGEG